MITPFITMRGALASDDYFASEDLLGADSWRAWRVILLVAMGEPLLADELAIFKELTGGREYTPGFPVEELWAVCGRRAGKTRAMAVLATFLAACRDYRSILAPGQLASVILMAASREQAEEAFRYVRGIFESSPALSQLVEAVTADSILLRTRVEIVVRAASFRRVRGFTSVAAIVDELAFFHSDSSANPDSEILNALRPSLATTSGPLIAISSPHARRGELYNAYRDNFGAHGDPRIVVIQAPSRTMNPSLSQRVIDRAYARDAVAAASEYGAEFRSDLEAFLTREIVESAITRGVRELPPIHGINYLGFVDPSGGSSDSMTIAIAHLEGDRAVLDAIRERKAPFSPEDVVTEYAALLKSYGLSSVTGDRYAGEWPRERFRTHGIAYEPSAKSRSELYSELLPLLNAGRAALVENDRLVTQLVSLERRTSRIGRDSVDHPPGAHDDLANAVAGALAHVSSLRPQERPRLAWGGVEIGRNSDAQQDFRHDQFRKRFVNHAGNKVDGCCCPDCQPHLQINRSFN
jgi:hypothetical protein